MSTRRCRPPHAEGEAEDEERHGHVDPLLCTLTTRRPERGG
uniref:Uncharacterized protein n=1 Tax=Oryza sativa subsp. japonica TaxID=39947 RepID=Q84SW4_ORYSJ|nr:hypothetical protein [Oryza sativa Japonica Group]